MSHGLKASKSMRAQTLSFSSQCKRFSNLAEKDLILTIEKGRENEENVIYLQVE
jgi:hypothetical protein